MQKISLVIIRIGLGLTFAWIGLLILREPLAWGGYLRPWAERLLPVPVGQAMTATGVMDIVIGAFLLAGVGTWIAALAAMAHVAIVLLVSGITDFTVRDIAIAAAGLALFLETAPARIRAKIVDKT